MLKTVSFFSKFWVGLFKTQGYLKVYNRMREEVGQAVALKYIEEKSTEWAKGVIKSAGANVTVKGVEWIPKEDGIVFVGNHQSNFDIPLLLGYLPKLAGFVAKKELEKMPFISSWMKVIGCVFLDRGNPRAALKTIGEATKKVKDGQNMILFPEGTRSKGQKMGDFKQGGLRIATKGKAIIVPMTIDGSYKLYEGNGNRIKPADVTITFHEPINTAELDKDAIKSLDDYLLSVIESGLNS